jgi:high-affinity nickel-transport protein
VLALPIVFAAGMSLVDTTDGAFMSKAYAWAFSSPVRKILYNLTVTSLSVFVAVFVGLMEATQILAQVLGFQGHLWTLIASLDFETLGLVIVATFVITWAGSFVLYRLVRVEGGSAEDRRGKA